MLLEMAAELCPTRTAFHDATTNESISFGGLYKGAGAKAQLLRELGVERCVVLDVANLCVPVALFSSAWCGIPYVPINYRLTRDEIQALLNRVKPALLVTDSEKAEWFEGQDGLLVQDRETYRATKPKENVDLPWSMEPDDIASLLFTSGTTGAPKAAIMRQKHLVSYILQSVEFNSAEEDESALVSVPPYHIAGIASVLSSVYATRKVVQLAAFTPSSWLDTAREHKTSTAFVVPTMLARIVEHLREAANAGLPNLQSLSYGGGKMPHTVVEHAMRLFPQTDFTNAYGLTETSSTITVLGPEEHKLAAASDDAVARRRLGSVGLPLPGIEIEIRDPDGVVQSPFSHGEIFVRGEQISGEYEGRESPKSDDGWFPTRDAGYLDSDGYLFLDGRADDIIVRGGENLSPGEIEDVLMEHPNVRDAAVIGVHSEEWGESVAAAVVLREPVGIAELQGLVRHRLRSSRVPEQIEIWDELPYNETGKLLRRQIKAEFGNRS